MKICPTCQNCFEDEDAVCPDDLTPLPAPRPGSRLIAQKYVLDHLLRSDEVEAEFAATRLQTERPVAVKILPPSAAGEADALKSFRREANAVAHLNTRFEHQHVVKTLDYGVLPDGAAYVVTEFVAGQSLRDYVESNQPLPVAAAARIARQVAEGLGAAHRSGVVHGDLNPSNIMVTRDHRDRPEAKVINFGFARLREHLPAALRAPLPTRPPGLDQTPYASPEQRAGHYLDARSDIYSLGVITFEMLAARLPSEAEAAVAGHDFAGEWAPLCDLNPGVSMPLARLVMRALHPKAVARFSSAGELARELRAVETAYGQPSQATEQPASDGVSPTTSSDVRMPADVAADDALNSPAPMTLPAFAPAADLPSEHQPKVAGAADEDVRVGDLEEEVVVQVGDVQVDDGYREFPEAVAFDHRPTDAYAPPAGAAAPAEESAAAQFFAPPAPETEPAPRDDLFWDDPSLTPPPPDLTGEGHASVRVKPYVEVPRYERRRRPVAVYVVCAAAVILGCIGGGALALRLVTSSPTRPAPSSPGVSTDARPTQQLASMVEPTPAAAISPTPENSPPAASSSPAESQTDALKEAKEEALKALTPEKSPLPTPPPLAVTPNAEGDLGSVVGEVSAVNPDATTLNPPPTPTAKTEAPPDASAAPVKANAGAKAAGESDVRCGLSVSRETMEVSRDGGSGSVTATLNNAAGGVSASTPDWADIVVFSEPQGADGGRVRYSVKSVSKKAGTYRLQLRSNCGSKSVAVHVR